MGPTSKRPAGEKDGQVSSHGFLASRWYVQAANGQQVQLVRGGRTMRRSCTTPFCAPSQMSKTLVIVQIQWHDRREEWPGAHGGERKREEMLLWGEDPSMAFGNQAHGFPHSLVESATIPKWLGSSSHKAFSLELGSLQALNTEWGCKMSQGELPEQFLPVVGDACHF